MSAQLCPALCGAEKQECTVGGRFPRFCLHIMIRGGKVTPPPLYSFFPLFFRVGETVSGTKGLRVSVSGTALQYRFNGLIKRYVAPRRHEQRPGALAGSEADAQHRSVFSPHPRRGALVSCGLFAGAVKAAFCTAHRRRSKQNAQMCGQSHPPGMQKALAVKQHKVGGGFQLPETAQNRRPLTKRQQPRNIGEMQREGCCFVLNAPEVGKRVDRYRRMRHRRPG